MKIAFVILAHKFPDQIIRLLNSLSMENAQDHFFIHIDKRATPVFKQVQTLCGTASNVFLIDRRCVCRWGQFSLVQATLNALQRVLNTK